MGHVKAFIFILVLILALSACSSKPEMVVILEPSLEYQLYGAFSDGLLQVQNVDDNGRHYYFIDKTGKLVINCEEYNNVIGHFSEGLLAVGKLNPEKGFDKYDCGFIDKSGNIAIPFIFDWIGLFQDGRAAYTENGKQGLIDIKGNIIVPADYNSIWYNGDGTWQVRKDDGDALIDKDGKFIIPFESGYRHFYSFSEGLIVAWKDEKCGFIDKAGNVVVPIKYYNANSFRDGVAYVLEINDGIRQEYFIDKTGTVVLNISELQYEYVEPYFSDGLCLVYNGKGFGFIDKTGTLVIPTIYDFPYEPNPYSFDPPDSFHDGRAIAKKDGKFGIIDTKGNAVAEVIYDDIKYFLDNNSERVYGGFVKALQGDKWGVLDYRTGEIIIPFEYDDILDMGEDGLIVVGIDGKYGIIQIVEK